MGILDFLTGGSSNSGDAAAPASAPVVSPAPAGVDPAWYNNYLTAAAANEKAYGDNHPWAWLTGSGRDAALANARISAPNDYFKMLAGQSSAQSGQLDVGQTIAFLRKMGFPIDANNIPATMNAPAAGAPGAMPPAPGGGALPVPPGVPPAAMSPQGGVPPQGGAPMPPPGASAPPSGAQPTIPVSAAPAPAMPPTSPAGAAAPPANDADAQRAFYHRMALAMGGLPKFASVAADYEKLARDGLPAGTTVIPSGQVADTITGKPIRTNVGTLAAQRAAQVANAEQGARASAQKSIDTNRIDREAASDLKEVTTPDGKKTLVPRADIVNRTGRFAPGGDLAGVPTTGFADNPYREPQIKETTKAQENGNDASVQQNAVDQLGAALNQFGNTGPFAEHAFKILSGLDQAGLTSPEMHDKLASGALAQMNSQTIVAAVAKAASAGRVPLGIYNQISKTKPGMLVSNPKLQLEALHQDFQRAKDLAGFTADYYSDHKNATKLDAQGAFEKAHPMAQYQSHVMPLTAPLKNGKVDRSALKTGYAYRMRDGATAIFDGSGFKAYGGLGQ